MVEMDRRLVVSILGATVVAGAIIGISSATMRKPTAATPTLGGVNAMAVGDSALAWLASPSDACGSWEASTARAAAVDPSVGPVATACDAFDQREVMAPLPQSPVTAASCQAWCEANHPPGGADTDAWCCELSRADGTPMCSWSNGFARLVASEAETEGSQAYGTCGPAATAPSADRLAAKILHTQYDCGSMRYYKSTDVVKVDGDGTTTCSQICLPPAFVNIAEKHGCSHGRCVDLGFTQYVYSTKNTGIPLNVFARPGVQVHY